MSENPCPCGSGHSYAACCARYIEGSSAAPSAEALMRSRYTAYALAQEDYLLKTWHPNTRPHSLDLAAGPARRWLGLKVVRAEEGSDEAVVEFVARCKINGRGQRLHETSRFVREDEQWLYVDGTIHQTKN